ncbi:MAG: ABC transporter substrate-binding protein [Deferrisomatales bacterium]
MEHRRLFGLAAVTLVAAGLAVGPARAAPPEPARLRIGTLPTEDALPLWAAEARGLFAKAGLAVEIITLPSAQERDAAFGARALDGFMGDLLAAAALEAAGSPVSVVTVMLGATPAEGRFGVVAAPGSPAKTLKDLAGVAVGTSTGTIQEYVLDGLLRAAGVPPGQVKVEEVKKVPVRFQLLMGGQLAAAALPEPLLSLAEAQGAKLLADDTGGANLSQTVLVVSDAFLATPGGAEAAKRLLAVWDQGAAAVNADPNAWRDTLVEKARLPEPLRATYQVNRYPSHQLPARAEVEAVLGWMVGKGLLRAPVTYDGLVWAPKE